MSDGTLTYRPDIDGLRAVAVLSVVGYHAFPGKVEGGFIGVDIFFVISGFLITSIILAQLGRGTFSLSEFYVRRVLRIFPAAALVFLACLAAGWWLLLPNEFIQLGKHVVGGAAFVSNLVLRSESGYFDTAAESKPLLHLWSLGIEEQYYLAWPLLAYVLVARRWNVLLVLAAALLASFASNVYWVHTGDISGAFYLPASRAWELVVGAALAYGLRGADRFGPPVSHVLSIAGLGAIAAGLAAIDRRTSFPGYWALLPTVGAAMLIAAGPAGVVNSRLLSSKFAVWVGKISYPLYLWHWPVLVYMKFAATDGFTRGLRLTAIGISVALAQITYALLERRVRAGSHKTKNAAILVSTMAVLAAVGALVWTAALGPRSSDPALVSLMSGVDDWAYPDGLQKITRDGVQFNVRAGSTGRTTVFWGDSHMEQYGPAVVALLAANDERAVNDVVFSTESACLPLPSVDSNYPNRQECGARKMATLRMLQDDKVDTVVVGACWNCFFGGKSYSMRSTPRRDNFAFSRGDDAVGLSTEAGTTLALGELQELLARLARTKRVFLVLDNPLSEDFDPASYVAGTRLTGLAPREVTPYADIPPMQERLRTAMTALAHRAGAEVLDPSAAICNGTRCRRLWEGRPIFRDGHHLLPFFVRAEAGFLSPAIAPRPAPNR